MQMPTETWSTTKPEIFERIGRAIETDRSLAVATVINVDGAAYRRSGAKAVISPAETYGGITAGCLEGPLRTIATDVIESRSVRTATYDLTENDEWGFGLGCNGVIDVLMEPIDDSWKPVVDAYTNGEACSLVTVVESSDPSISVGARAVIDGQGSRADDAGEHGRAALPTSVVEDIETRARTCANEGSVDRVTVSTERGTLVLVIDGVEPPRRLVVFGSQPDVHPVTRLATQVGLQVTVASARGGRANEDVFPSASHVQAVHPTELADLGLDERTAVVIMSHNFLDDRLALEAALETETPYIGLMGPRKRFEELRSALETDGVELSASDRERIATPVGLDLGGDEPMEIALSIVSEVVAVGNDRSGDRLTNRTGPIHDREPVSLR